MGSKSNFAKGLTAGEEYETKRIKKENPGFVDGIYWTVYADSCICMVLV